MTNSDQQSWKIMRLSSAKERNDFLQMWHGLIAYLQWRVCQEFREVLFTTVGFVLFMNGHLVFPKHLVRFSKTCSVLIWVGVYKYKSGLQRKKMTWKLPAKESPLKSVYTVSDWVFLVGLCEWSFGNCYKQCGQLWTMTQTPHFWATIVQVGSERGQISHLVHNDTALLSPVVYLHSTTISIMEKSAT